MPVFLVRKFFTQIFCFINVQLFNALLLRRECCSFSNGEYIKTGLAELENWLIEYKDWTGNAWEELRYIRQAVQLLVIHQKPKKTLNEITLELCPVLSIQQLYRISTMYWDDKYGTETVSQEVLVAMKELMMKDQNTNMSNSFLLDDEFWPSDDESGDEGDMDLKRAADKSAVERVLGANDHFDVLSLPRDCSAADVKKAFLKLSKEVRPVPAAHRGRVPAVAAHDHAARPLVALRIVAPRGRYIPTRTRTSAPTRPSICSTQRSRRSWTPTSASCTARCIHRARQSRASGLAGWTPTARRRGSASQTQVVQIAIGTIAAGEH